MTETTKPVVTQALSEMRAMLAEYEARAEARRQESADGMKELVAMLENRLAHSPSEPSVVSQDLVDLLQEAADFIQPFNRAEELLDRIEAAIAKTRGEA